MRSWTGWPEEPRETPKRPASIRTAQLAGAGVLLLGAVLLCVMIWAFSQIGRGQ